MNTLNKAKEIEGQLMLLEESLTGLRGEDQHRIAMVGLEWVTTILRKNNDYGGSVWTRPILAPECTKDAAIRVRMSDKIGRLVKILSSHRALEVRESFEDTVSDLGAYCLLLLAMPVGDDLQDGEKIKSHD